MKDSIPELGEFQKEFDFLHKRIGEIEWELTTIWYGKKAVLGSESEMLEDQLENYRENIGILVEKVRNEITRINQAKKHL